MILNALVHVTNKQFVLVTKSCLGYSCQNSIHSFHFFISNKCQTHSL